MFLGALFVIDNIKVMQNKYQFQKSISNNQLLLFQDELENCHVINFSF